MYGMNDMRCIYTHYNMINLSNLQSTSYESSMTWLHPAPAADVGRLGSEILVAAHWPPVRPWGGDG